MWRLLAECFSNRNSFAMKCTSTSPTEQEFTVFLVMAHNPFLFPVLCFEWVVLQLCSSKTWCWGGRGRLFSIFFKVINWTSCNVREQVMRLRMFCSIHNLECYIFLHTNTLSPPNSAAGHWDVYCYPGITVTLVSGT